MKMGNPKIYLIARPQLNMSEITRFLEARGFEWARSPRATDPEEVVEVAGRLCYMSFSSDKERVTFPNSRYIANLIDKGHDSVLEHSNWTFLIDGVSRAFTHQLVRHRIGFSYSQLSQQYHEETDAAAICPEGLDANTNPEGHKLWLSSIEHSKQAYVKLLSLMDRDDSQSSFENNRQIRSAARSVLPNATETAIMVTANARALRHFFDARGNIPGDPEMRRVSVALYKIVSEEAPSLFFDYKIQAYSDGSSAVVKKTRQPD